MAYYERNSRETENPTIEKEFRIKYGCYPDRFYTNKLKDGLSPSDAAVEVQERIEVVWKEMVFNFRRKKATA